MTAMLFANLPELPPAAAPIEARWVPVISFFVPGIPRPGGSKKAHLIPKRGGGFVTRQNGSPLVVVRDDAKGNAEWKQTVAFFGGQAFQSDPIDEVLAVRVCFVMPRLKGHFRASGEPKANAPIFHRVKPDSSKLWRSTEDALTGVIWRDDSSIVKQEIVKVYGAKVGAHIEVFKLEGGA